MTLEERQKAAMQALKDIEVHYGLRVVAVIQPEQYNPGAVMVKAALALDPVPNWIPTSQSDGILKPENHQSEGLSAVDKELKK